MCYTWVRQSGKSLISRLILYANPKRVGKSFKASDDPFLLKGGFIMTGQNKGLAVLSYITWIGWLISMFARKKEDTLVAHHLNQALVIWIISTVAGLLARIQISAVQTVAGIVGFACLVFCIWGIIRAAKGSEEPLPLVGGIKIIS
jgi:uncharacterized membrane protein